MKKTGRQKGEAAVNSDWMGGIELYKTGYILGWTSAEYIKLYICWEEQGGWALIIFTGNTWYLRSSDV